jgi:tetratricopeptide (TPR) repeat protein
MSESIHDTDSRKTAVAIAAESKLDREGAEHGDGTDQSVTLIMSALEKMASATDQLAKQMSERLEEVERDMGDARTDDMADDLMDGLKDQIQKFMEPLRDVMSEQGGHFADEVKQLREEFRSAREDQTSSWKEEISALREEIDSAREATKDIFAEAAKDRAEQTETTLQGQRAMVADLAEGIALVQTSMAHRITELDDQARKETDEVLRHWNEFSKAHEERQNAMAEQMHEVREFGERLKEEHSEMVRVFEQEKDRAELAAEDRQREQARRINNSGVARYHAGDYDQARVLFEQAVQSDLRFAEAFNNLGLALSELGEDEDATVAFETAIEINPELGAGYNNLGYVLYLQENFEAAIEMYKEAIGREHDTSAAYTNLGNAWQKLEQTEKAVKAWSRALEVDPSNERAQRYLDRFAGPAA